MKMISMENLFKVAEEMLPLYISLGLGYASLRWWRLISAEQCKAIDHLVFFITLPLFTFQLTLGMDPFAMNYRMIGADAISKVLVAVLLLVAYWTSCRLWLGHRGQERPTYCRAITSFSLTQFTNSLVVGLPLVKAMYGSWAQEVVVQLSVVQAIVWLPLLQFAFELWKARYGYLPSEVQMASIEASIEAPPPPSSTGERAELAAARPSSGSLIKVVLLSLAKNPNTYASIIGIAWACLSNRWHLETPRIIEKSIHIMSNAGPGMAMFSLGLFTASQEKLFTCGPKLTAYAMALKFIGGPAAMAVGAFSIGLRGELLHLAIIQAAVPQSIISFIFAKKYELDVDVLSTAVTFGMLISLPVLVLYSMILGYF